MAPARARPRFAKWGSKAAPYHPRAGFEGERTKVEAERAAALIRAAALEGELAGLRETLAEARKPFWRRWIG